jgi:hypothetical protein
MSCEMRMVQQTEVPKGKQNKYDDLVKEEGST